MVMILIASASAFAYMLTFHQVPLKHDRVSSRRISENPIAILLMMNLPCCWFWA